MFNSQAQQNQLDPNDPNFRMAPAHIPPGKFIDIDEQYYLPKPEPMAIPDNSIRQYPNPVNNSGFVDLHPVIDNDFNQKVNYGSYLYNQITGYQ
jgi:hypothetical protein